MAYEDIAALSVDTQFRSRLSACLTSEAILKSDDPLADLTLLNPQYATQLFQPIVSSAPGFADTYDESGQEAIEDGQILSAVQASWDRVAGLISAPTP